MVLSDKDIVAAVKAGRIVIEPWNESMVQPASVDLHLGDNFMVFDSNSHAVIDPKSDTKQLMRKIDLSADGHIVVHPGEFLLGTSVEKITFADDLVGRLDGKSSLGRIGLIVHSTAGFFDPGFSGQCTLEISNLANMPIILYPGMKICQMSFMQLSSRAQMPYGPQKGSHYQGQMGATAADLSGVVAGLPQTKK